MSSTCAVDTRFQTPLLIVFEVTCISAPMRLKSSGWKTIHILARLSATGLSSSQPWRRHPTPAVKAITRMARAPAPCNHNDLDDMPSFDTFSHLEVDDITAKHCQQCSQQQQDKSERQSLEHSSDFLDYWKGFLYFSFTKQRCN